MDLVEDFTALVTPPLSPKAEAAAEKMVIKGRGDKIFMVEETCYLRRNLWFGSAAEIFLLDANRRACQKQVVLLTKFSAPIQVRAVQIW